MGETPLPKLDDTYVAFVFSPAMTKLRPLCDSAFIPSGTHHSLKRSLPLPFYLPWFEQA